jgi:hypothetical protein
MEYKFLKSDFAEPIINGVNNSRLGEPFLQFFKRIEGPIGQRTIVIQVDFNVEGFLSDFRFNAISRSFFQIIDAENIVVSDVYDMYSKAIEDLRAFLDYRIGENGVSTIGVPMPRIEDVMDELVEFVTVLHREV